MNAAAKAVMTEISDIIVGYGVSDEYRYNYYHYLEGIILN